VIALSLGMYSLAVSYAPEALAAAGPGNTVQEIRGLKRTNQVLSILLALLKLLDEIPTLPPGDPPLPGPIHPGPGPLPVVSPDDSGPALRMAGPAGAA
jgi:hypothetical protein